MEGKFSMEEAVVKLWDKLDGWLNAIILKLPNIVMAILVIIVFYFLAKGIRKIARKYILRKISQKSIQDIMAKAIFLIVNLIGFFYCFRCFRTR